MDRKESAADFVLRVATRLGEPAPRALDYGATKAARLVVAGRRIEVLAGRTFEVEVGLSLPGFPSGAGITYAPEGLYARAKLLEGCSEQTRAVAGVEVFDQKFLVLGPGAPLVLARLASEALDALCEADDLRPDIETMKLVWGQPPESFVHLRARPSVEHLGQAETGQRDPEPAVRAIEDAVALAVRLERAWSPPP